MSGEPKTPTRTRVAAVIGASQASEEQLAAAEAIGRGLVEAGLCVATGGLGGVMAAASKGARAATGWTPGRVIGVLPSLDADTANPWVDVAIPTGLHYARNVVLVSMADVVIAVGGGSGTLSEIALAWQHHKPIVALTLGAGWAPRLAGASLDARRADAVHAARSAAEAVAAAVALAAQAS